MEGKNNVTMQEKSSSTRFKAIPRSDLRKKSTLDENFRVSLQTCPLNANEIKLQGLLSQVNNSEGRKANMLHGLLLILNQLLAPSEEGNSIGFMEFDDAYYLYCGFFPVTPPEKETFRDNLLHPEHGLAVLIASIIPGKRYVWARRGCTHVNLTIYYNVLKLYKICNINLLQFSSGRLML